WRAVALLSRWKESRCLAKTGSHGECRPRAAATRICRSQALDSTARGGRGNQRSKAAVAETTPRPMQANGQCPTPTAMPSTTATTAPSKAAKTSRNATTSREVSVATGAVSSAKNPSTIANPFGQIEATGGEGEAILGDRACQDAEILQHAFEQRRQVGAIFQF